MSDYFFKHFYDSVKDPAWPEINNYSEFSKLPQSILEECRRVHNLHIRLEQLEDKAYWVEKSGLNLVYIHDNVAYLPIPKCASVSYTSFFHDYLGWQPKQLTEIDCTRIQVFALIINPLSRRLKGVVQTLNQSYKNNLDEVLKALKDQSFLDFISRVMIVDNHTTPYSLFFEPWFDLVHWIPMDLLSCQEVNTEIMTFLQKHHVQLDLSEVPRLNESNDKKKNIYKIIQQKFLTTEPPAELGIMFAKDMKFYNRLVERYATL